MASPIKLQPKKGDSLPKDNGESVQNPNSKTANLSLPNSPENCRNCDRTRRKDGSQSSPQRKNTPKIITYQPKLGLTLLLGVNFLWSLASELKIYFTNIGFIESYSKPYFETWFSMSFYLFFLFGFAFYGPWRRQCIRCACYDDTGVYSPLELSDESDEEGEVQLYSYDGHHDTGTTPQLNQDSSDRDQENQGLLANEDDQFSDLDEDNHLENTVLTETNANSNNNNTTIQTPTPKRLRHNKNNPINPAFCFSEPEFIKTFASDADSIITASSTDPTSSLAVDPDADEVGSQHSSVHSFEDEVRQTRSRSSSFSSNNSFVNAESTKINKKPDSNSNNKVKKSASSSSAFNNKNKKKKQKHKKRGVKFNRMKEVVRLFDNNDTWMARMSHNKFTRMKGRLKELDSRNRIIDLIRIASIFTLPMFVLSFGARQVVKYSPTTSFDNLFSALPCFLGCELI